MTFIDFRLLAMLGAACLAWAATTRAAAGAEHVWIIGGGYDPESSQAQIESNVLWARRVAGDVAPDARVRVYFTDGRTPHPDVKEWREPAEAPSTLQPLARVLNSYFANGEHYRNHRIEDVSGTTRAPELKRALRRDFAAVQAGDRVLIVFNGHGGYDEQDTAGNSIWLWDYTQLSVDEMAALLEEIPERASVRFVFTQCYAGAFRGLAAGGTKRCGFLAEAEDRQAEGCSASLELGDYRDYSTYFFAALAGTARDGGPLASDPDRDGDGEVNLREAHLYTLRHAASADLPRSTSEGFLNDWLPWYLGWAHWVDTAQAGDEYAELARELATERGLSPDESLARQLRQRRKALRAERESLQRRQSWLQEAIASLREPMEDELLLRWPGAGNGYTLAYRRFLEQDVSQAQRFIMGHRDYPALVREQQRYWALERELLDNERALNGLDKIERLLWLARVRGQLERFGGAAARQRYQDLLACEEQPL